jgi:hypothetical protein
VEELQALRTKDVQLATEVVQDLKDMEEFGLALPEKRLHATIFQKKDREIPSAVKKRAVERTDRWRKERGV